MKSRTTALAVGVATATVALASVAHAVDMDFLTEGSGWHYGESHATGSTKMYNYDAINGNQFTLTAVVTGNDDLDFVDGYVPGDIYSVTVKSVGGTVTSKTQFLGPAAFDPIPNLFAGPFGTTFGPAWLNAAYGHLQDTLSPGTYTITVKDLNGSGGYPAGWGIRLDAVPEAPTWAIMLLGVAGMGVALRNRRKALAA